MTVLVGALAGGLGAVSRYLVVHLVQSRSGSRFPFGTATVNLTGSFLMGLTVGTGLYGTLLVGLVGFFGGYTTFSTLMVETFRLGTTGAPRSAAVANLTLTTVLGVALAAAGYYLAAA